MSQTDVIVYLVLAFVGLAAALCVGHLLTPPTPARSSAFPTMEERIDRIIAWLDHAVTSGDTQTVDRFGYLSTPDHKLVKHRGKTVQLVHRWAVHNGGVVIFRDACIDPEAPLCEFRRYFISLHGGPLWEIDLTDDVAVKRAILETESAVTLAHYVHRDRLTAALAEA